MLKSEDKIRVENRREQKSTKVMDATHHTTPHHTTPHHTTPQLSTIHDNKIENKAAKSERNDRILQQHYRNHKVKQLFLFLNKWQYQHCAVLFHAAIFSFSQSDSNPHPNPKLNPNPSMQ